MLNLKGSSLIRSSKPLTSSTVPTTNQKQIFYCIRLSFLQPKNYKLLYDNSLKLTKLYQQYSQTIQNYFKVIHEYSAHLKQIAPLMNMNQKNVQFLELFRMYLNDYGRITDRITQYQLGCFKINRNSINQGEELSMALNFVLENAKKYAPFQKEIRDKKEKLTTEYTQIKNQYLSLNKLMKKPKYFYDKKYMRSHFNPLKLKIQQHQKNQQSILNDIINVNQNTTIFAEQVHDFRKQLLRNKYKYHKKFMNLATNSKQSLVQLFFYQYNCLNEYKKKITFSMETQNDQFSMLRKDNKIKEALVDPPTCAQIISENTQSFIKILQKIQGDLRINEQNLADVLNRLKIQEQRKFNKNYFVTINNFFQIDETPAKIMLQSMNAFQFCIRRLSEKTLDWKKAADQISQIRKSIIKHKGITISLLKVKMLSSKSNQINKSFSTLQNKDKIDDCGVYQIMNELDLKPVKQVINRCLDKMFVTFRQIIVYFNERNDGNRKMKLNNSMDLSYQEEMPVQNKKKRPFKDQLWLWEQHKKKVDTEFTLSTQLFHSITQNYNLFKDQTDIDLELQKYSCYCDSLQQNGDLCLSKKSIRFISRISSRQLYVSLSQIQQIKHKTLRMIHESIIIQTKIGDLVFRQFQNFSHVQTSLKQLVQSGGGAGNKKIKGKQKIQLTQEEKMKILSRKEQVQKERIKLDNFQEVFQRVFEGIKIDQFYYLILSDKKFDLTGKQHDSFLVYAMKKMNNKDFKITKFEPPGPKYYTLDENTTFKNCPIVSQCKYEYVHLLHIPFLPSQVSNKQQRKIYWVSDKQIDYFIHAQTFGVPMSQNFYVELLYRITEEGENTKMKVYARIHFLKSFALKSTVESSTWKEIREGTTATVEQIAKGIKLYKNLLSGQLVDVQNQEEIAEIDAKKQMEKLRNRNMYLIIGIVLILIINLVIKFFF